MTNRKHDFWHHVFKSILIYIVIEFLLRGINYWWRRRIHRQINRNIH